MTFYLVIWYCPIELAIVVIGNQKYPILAALRPQQLDYSSRYLRVSPQAH